MKASKTQTFSQKTLDFLTKAGKQRNPDWLEKNSNEYQKDVRGPFIELAEKIKFELGSVAKGYHFPSKGLARIKRPDHKVVPGQALFKNWISMIATRPSENRFESNPHLFFGIFTEEEEFGNVLLAGGLWQPTSQQTKRIRKAIADDATPFHELFADKEFKTRFKKGFYMDDQSSRVPRGYSDNHPDVEWLKLKKFVVMKKLSMKEFTSPKLSDSVIKDYKQALRLNALLDKALQGDW